MEVYQGAQLSKREVGKKNIKEFNTASKSGSVIFPFFSATKSAFLYKDCTASKVADFTSLADGSSTGSAFGPLEISGGTPVFCCQLQLGPRCTVFFVANLFRTGARITFLAALKISGQRTCRQLQSEKQ